MGSLNLSCPSLDFLITGKSVHPDSKLGRSRLSLLTSIYLSFFLSFFLSFYLPVSLSACLFVCLSVSLHLSGCLPVSQVVLQVPY